MLCQTIMKNGTPNHPESGYSMAKDITYISACCWSRSTFRREKKDNVYRLQTPASTRVRSTTLIGVRGNAGTRGRVRVAAALRRGTVAIFSLRNIVAIRSF